MIRNINCWHSTTKKKNKKLQFSTTLIAAAANRFKDKRKKKNGTRCAVSRFQDSGSDTGDNWA